MGLIIPDSVPGLEYIEAKPIEDAAAKIATLPLPKRVITAKDVLADIDIPQLIRDEMNRLRGRA